MNIDIPALPEAQQTKVRNRRSSFYMQTVSETNSRLGGITTIEAVIKEIKFIESILLSKGGQQ